MTYEQRIKVSNLLIKELECKIPSMQKPTEIDLEELKKLTIQISFLKEIRDESMKRIGQSSSREQKHEQTFYGRQT